MKKINYTLSLFGEDKPKELTPQEMSTKIDQLEQALKDKDTQIANVTNERDALQQKLNGLRVTGLVKQVETISQPQDEEPVQFDFDL